MDAWRRAGTTSTGRETASNNANTLPLGRGGGRKRGHPEQVLLSNSKLVLCLYSNLSKGPHGPLQRRYTLGRTRSPKTQVIRKKRYSKGFEFLQHFFLCRHGFALGNDQRALPNMLALPAPKDVCVKAKGNLSQC